MPRYRSLITVVTEISHLLGGMMVEVPRWECGDARDRTDCKSGQIPT